MADLQELYPNFDTPERGRIKTVAESLKWLADAIENAYTDPEDGTHYAVKASFNPTAEAAQAMAVAGERVVGYQVRAEAEAEALVEVNNNSLDPEVLSEKDRALYWSRIAQEMASDKPIRPVFEETAHPGVATNEQFGLAA